MKKLICDRCGKELCSEYWDGGYIDHYENFARHGRSYLEWSNAATPLSKDIIFSGNNLRPEWVIRDLLDCCMSWDFLPEDVKNETKRIVEAMLEEILKARKEVLLIKETASPMAIAILRNKEIHDSYQDTYRSILKKGLDIL